MATQVIFNLIILVALLLNVSCRPESEYVIKTEDFHEVVNGKKVIVGQVVQSLRKTDNRPISKLTRVFNYDNDPRIKQLTGLTKDKGFKDYLLDSIYYDSKGNDTLKTSYIHLDKWYRIQLTRKKFPTGNKVDHFITERNIKGRPVFRKEIFYKYSATGQILSATEFECSQMVDCDSLYKTIFIYDSDGGIDSTMYTWTDKKWSVLHKNGR